MDNITRREAPPSRTRSIISARLARYSAGGTLGLPPSVAQQLQSFRPNCRVTTSGSNSRTSAANRSRPCRDVFPETPAFTARTDSDASEWRRPRRSSRRDVQTRGRSTCWPAVMLSPIHTMRTSIGLPFVMRPLPRPVDVLPPAGNPYRPSRRSSALRAASRTIRSSPRSAETTRPSSGDLVPDPPRP